jgi:hypothetical protein
MFRNEWAKTRLMRVGISVTAPTTPGTLTNSGWTFGRKRTHEDGWTRRELVVAVANHHCNGPKPYLYSRIYQVFFQNLFTLYRLLSTPSLLSAVRHAFICHPEFPAFSECPLQEFPRKIRCGFLGKPAAQEKGVWQGRISEPAVSVGGELFKPQRGADFAGERAMKMKSSRRGLNPIEFIGL